MQFINNARELKGVDFDALRHALYMGIDVDDSNIGDRQKAVQGYLRNVIVYRCIEEITRSARIINIKPTINGEVVDLNQQRGQSDFIRLFKSPAPGCTWDKLLRNLLSNYLYSGSCFMLGYDAQNGRAQTDIPTKLPTELMSLNAYEMTVNTPETNNYIISSFEHRNDKGAQHTYAVDPLTGKSRVFYLHSFHPLQPVKGLSPLMPAAYNVDTHNEGSRWNLNLLRNSAAPSGIFTTDQTLSDNAFSRLAKQIKEYFTGSRNSGRAMTLESGLKFEAMGLSPKEMDFIDGADAAARNIASAYGVPFALILPEASTYNNQRDARMSLYENTVIPLLTELLDNIAIWFNSIDDAGYGFKIDMDSISALEDKRQMKYDRMVQVVGAGILTPDEARNELGYEPLGGEASTLNSESEALNNQDEAVKRVKQMYDQCLENQK